MTPESNPAPVNSPLHRELTIVSAAALVVSNMIGTGIFTTTGFLARDLGRPSLVLGVWLAGAVVALAGSLAYGELGVNFPRSGGEYVYLREAWGPTWGFLSGWVSFFAGFSAPIAAGALAFSEYAGRLFPSLLPAEGEQASALGVHFGRGQLMAVGVIAAFAAVNILGLSLAAKLQNALTALKLAVLVTFLGLAFALGRGHWENFSLAAERVSAHSLSAQFAVSLVFVMYAYSGWNAATYVAEEIKEPERVLPASLLAGTTIVAVVYLALNAAFIYALPLASLKGVVSVGAAASASLFGARAGNLFAGVMAVSILSCVSAMMVVGPRVYYAMALDGCFFSAAARVSPGRRTPVQSVVFQATAASVMVLTGTFEKLIVYIGFTLVLFAALAVAGLFQFRRQPGWKRTRAVDQLYPVVPGLFILAAAWMLVYAFALRRQESLYGLLTVAAGAAVYRFGFAKRD